MTPEVFDILITLIRNLSFGNKLKQIFTINVHYYFYKAFIFLKMCFIF